MSEQAYAAVVPSAFGSMPTPEQLAELVPAVPPLVTAKGISDHPHLAAALLTWGRADIDWYAGISFIYNIFRGSRLTALITVWVPGNDVEKRASETYSRVPRHRLTGGSTGWPTLPARYPGAGPEWLSKHIHAAAPDLGGEFRELRDEIRRLSRRSEQ